MDIKYNMPYVKKSQMHIVYTQIVFVKHTQNRFIHNYKVFQKTTICYIFKDNKYNITMCPIKIQVFKFSLFDYLSLAQLYIIVLLSSRKHFQLHDPLMRNPPANPYSP